MGQGNSQTFGLSPPSCLRFTIRPEEVATHQTEDDCWVIVGDQVLDVTNFLSGILSKLRASLHWKHARTAHQGRVSVEVVRSPPKNDKDKKDI